MVEVSFPSVDSAASKTLTQHQNLHAHATSDIERGCLGEARGIAHQIASQGPWPRSRWYERCSVGRINSGEFGEGHVPPLLGHGRGGASPVGSAIHVETE